MRVTKRVRNFVSLSHGAPGREEISIAKRRETAFGAELLCELRKRQDAATVLCSDGLVGEPKKVRGLRLMRDAQRLPPQRQTAPVVEKAYTGTIVTERSESDVGN